MPGTVLPRPDGDIEGHAESIFDLTIGLCAYAIENFPDSPFAVDYRGRTLTEPGVIVAAMRDLALRRAMLTERRAGTPLRDRQNASNMLDAGAATRGAQ